MNRQDFIGALNASKKRNPKYLHIVTLYDTPTDYPDEFVARVSMVKGSERIAAINLVITTRTRVALFEVFKGTGLTFLPRHTNDDPNIIGCFL